MLGLPIRFQLLPNEPELTVWTFKQTISVPVDSYRATRNDRG